MGPPFRTGPLGGNAENRQRIPLTFACNILDFGLFVNGRWGSQKCTTPYPPIYCTTGHDRNAGFPASLAIDAKISKTNQMIEDSSAKFEQIKARIINEGERAKQKIIEDAKTQSKKIIELEKLKVENRIVQAKNQFMAELVDAASALAQNRLPAEITDQDHQQLLNLFLSNITHATEQTT